MADKAFPITEQTAGTLDNVDASTLTVGANTVMRQRINISDPTTAAAHAAVENANPGATDYGLVTRPIKQRGTKTTSNTAISVTTAATSIIAANTARKGLIITNNGTVPVYLGIAGVTTANGIPLPAGASLTDDVTTDAWYGIVASGTADVRVVEIS